MPGSVIQGKQEIKEWFEKRNDIKVVLDIGAGSGTYPKLLGKKYEYIGVEIWKEYIDLFQLYKYYKRILIGNVTSLDLPEADCIIFGDILEHVEKKQALEVLSKAFNKYPHVVLSIPISYRHGEIRPAEVHYGNKHEAHVSAWDFDKIKDMFNWSFAKLCGKNSIGIFIK